MYSLMILFLLFSIFLIKGVKLIGGGNDYNNSIVSKDFSDILKAFFSLIIIGNHLAASMSEPLILEDLFRNVGFICVAFFFFISGYGTMYGYKNNPQYLSGFVYNKILKIVIPYCICIAIYTLAEVMTGTSYKECILSFAQGMPVAKYSWYIIAVLIFYLIFYISFNQAYINKQLLFVFLSVVYMIFCIFVKWPLNWYNTFVAFFVGMIIEKNKQKIIDLKNKGYILSFSILILIFSWIFTSYTEYSIITLGVYWLGSISVCIIITVASMVIRIENNILKFISKFSMELYLYHGLTNSLLKKVGMIRNSNYLYGILAYVFAFLFAYVMFNINKKVVRRKI